MQIYCERIQNILQGNAKKQKKRDLAVTIGGAPYKQTHTHCWFGMFLFLLAFIEIVQIVPDAQ